MTTITIDEMQQDLVGYLDRVQSGETFMIVIAGKAVAEIKPVDQDPDAKQLRPFGLCLNEFSVPEDFDAPLSPDMHLLGAKV